MFFFALGSDEELVEKAQRGDEAAISALYSKYVKPIYRFCYWQTRTIEEAQDLSQQVFLEMIRSLASFQHRSSFKNWLYTIAKHLVSGWIAQKYKIPQLPIFDTVTNPDQWIDEDNAAYKERVVHDLLNTLKPAARKVLELRYLRGYSVKETAKALKLTESNVKVTTKRALETLTTRHPEAEV